MQPIHAVNFAPFSPRGAFSTPQAKAGLCAMKEQTCADTVIFCPVEQIDFQGKHTTSDEELLDMTRLARQLGLRVFWKPTVNCLDGTWRARISFFDHDVLLSRVSAALCPPGPTGRGGAADPGM